TNQGAAADEMQKGHGRASIRRLARITGARMTRWRDGCGVAAARFAHNGHPQEALMKLLLGACLLFAFPTFAADTAAIEKALASAERTAADRERDARDKPAELLAFAGVKPGMVV